MAGNSYGNILVPYDSSKFSQNALEMAKMLAKSHGATLHLATIVDVSYVTPPGLIRSEETKKTFAQIRDSIRRSAESILEQKKQECIKEGIKALSFVMEGSVLDELLVLIKKNDIDLVIIGSQGLSGFSRLKALGSVSRRISEIAECPVMIVH